MFKMGRGVPTAGSLPRLRLTSPETFFLANGQIVRPINTRRWTVGGHTSQLSLVPPPAFNFFPRRDT